MENNNIPRFRRLTETRYFKWGATVFVVGALLLLAYQIVFNYSGFKSGLGTLKTILSPFIYGFVMAYLLSPIYNFVIRKTYPVFKSKTTRVTTAYNISKVLATVVSLFVLIGVVAGILALLIPQVIESIRGLAATLPGRFDQFNIWVDNVLGNMDNHEMAETIYHYVDEMQGTLLDWVQDKLLPGVGSFVERLSVSVISTLRTVFNIVIGVIACAYFLNGKETFRAQFKKFIWAFFSKERAAEVFEFFRYSNKTFGGFITAKIVDSIIVGLICFVAMSILGLPYPILISTIIGVTNIIPFFGPFIGGIPSFAIIFIVNPVQSLWFLILIFLLQQFDGNVLGPAILGSSIGIASFWVMFAIVVGGGLFGFMGMVLGVPIFAILYYYWGKQIDKQLDKKGMPAETVDYIDLDKYQIDKDDIIHEVLVIEGEAAKETADGTTE